MQVYHEIATHVEILIKRNNWSINLAKRSTQIYSCHLSSQALALSIHTLFTRHFCFTLVNQLLFIIMTKRMVHCRPGVSLGGVSKFSPVSRGVFSKKKNAWKDSVYLAEVCIMHSASIQNCYNVTYCTFRTVTLFFVSLTVAPRLSHSSGFSFSTKIKGLYDKILSWPAPTQTFLISKWRPLKYLRIFYFICRLDYSILIG